MNNLRFWTAALLLAGTALLLYARPDTDHNPPYAPLSQFPVVLGGWTGADQPIDQETLDVLGSGEFLARIYTRGAQAAPIGLFIGYFPTQRTGQTIHSPKHCLPGAGWKAAPGWRVYDCQRRRAAVRHLLVRGAWAQRGQ
jgi:EpsI family protein